MAKLSRRQHHIWQQHSQCLNPVSLPAVLLPVQLGLLTHPLHHVLLLPVQLALLTHPLPPLDPVQTAPWVWDDFVCLPLEMVNLIKIK